MITASLQTDNHASTPPLTFVQAEYSSCRPTNSVKALKAKHYYAKHVTSDVGCRMLQGCSLSETDASYGACARSVYEADVDEKPVSVNTQTCYSAVVAVPRWAAPQIVVLGHTVSLMPPDVRF